MFLPDLGFQDGNSCAQMRRGIVKKFQHERVPFERLLDDAALYADAAAVDEAHVVESCRMRFVDVVRDDRGDVSRRERVQVEGAFDRDPKRPSLGDVEGVLILHFSWLGQLRIAAALSYLTVTSVLMPPRTEKSPTTVIWRG